MTGAALMELTFYGWGNTEERHAHTVHLVRVTGTVKQREGREEWQDGTGHRARMCVEGRRERREFQRLGDHQRKGPGVGTSLGFEE